MNQNEECPEVDAFSTHQVPLISAVLQTEGPVIEFGTGYYSTSILHELCKGRKLWSVDAYAKWLDQFRHLECGNHRFLEVPPSEWGAIDEEVDTVDWSVVFIDHGCDVSWRAREILRQKDRADLIVVHDSNVGAYGFEEVFSQFKYQFEYTPHVLHTMVLSNTQPFELLTPHNPKVR